MPVLNWIGKNAVVGSHRRAPYHLVHCNGKLSSADVRSSNLLIHGDNLLALKAILPYYRGRVKCVYIDPPYNTGNGGWIYNDRADSPEIRDWLGKTVRGDAGDMTRHDKWLCMMHPRISLLREFLRPDGVIFASIDDNEIHHLRMLMDEIFREQNFVGGITWESRTKPVQSGAAKYRLQQRCEYVLCYARDKDRRGPFNLRRSGTRAYKKQGELGLCRHFDLEDSDYGAKRAPKMKFPILGISPPPGRRWKIGKAEADRLVEAGRIVVVNGRVKKVIYPEDESDDIFSPFWSHFSSKDVGAAENGKATLDQIFGKGHGFDTVKPVDLIKELIFASCGEDDLVLDSFAGTGTTGHAVLQLNMEDGGTRQFILVEMKEDICRDFASRRLSRVVRGYKRGDNGKEVAGTGGGFRYCELGEPLFGENGKIAGKVKFADLAAHVFFSETGIPIPKRAAKKSPLLGEFRGKAVYLLFNGVLGDKDEAGGNVLDDRTLPMLPAPRNRSAVRVVYAESCDLGESDMLRQNIAFRQIPTEVKDR